jgi:hypothetical protein
MLIIDWTKTFLVATTLLSALSTVSYAQQWNGPGNPTGRVWRPGYVTVGGEPSQGADSRAVLDVKLPPDGLDDLAFRTSFSYQNALVEKFAVDRHRAYAGAARSKASGLARRP